MRIFTLVLGLLLGAPFAVLAEPPRVVTDIAPVQSIVARVMHGIATPELLLRAEISPHHATLKPSQARMLAQADLVVWVGPQLTGWLEGPLENLATGAQMRLLDLLAVPEMTGLNFREFDGDDDHEEEDDHGHFHAGGIDPHLWLDPVNAALMAREIAGKLGELDPENAETYLMNADAFNHDIVALLPDVAEMFAGLEGTRFIVLHDAFQYFEHRFGVEASGNVFDSHANSPGPQRIVQLRQLVREQGIICAFAEPQQNTDLLDTVAEGTNLRIATLDPMGDGSGYIALLDSLARAMSDCLRGE